MVANFVTDFTMSTLRGKRSKIYKDAKLTLLSKDHVAESLAERETKEKARIELLFKKFGAGIPQHGLSSNKMALITSDCDAMRSPRTKWP